MGKAIGEILPYALAAAVSVIPIIAIILMLVTPKAKTNGTAFAVGYVLGFALVGTIVLVLAGAKNYASSPPLRSPALWPRSPCGLWGIGVLWLPLGLRSLGGSRMIGLSAGVRSEVCWVMLVRFGRLARGLVFADMPTPAESPRRPLH